MKIAIIRQKYVIYGGAEHFASEYILELARAGHEVHVFANRWVTPDLPNIHFHKVPALRFNSFLRSLTFAWFAERAVRDGGFDVIQSHERTWRQDVYRAGDGCHAEWLERRKKYLPPWRRWLINFSPFHRLTLAIERKIFTPGRYKKIVAISDMVKRDILRHYSVPANDIAVVYNGVRLEQFHPGNRARWLGEIRAQFNIPVGDFLILHVGSGFERKGLKYLFQALEFLPESGWRLLVIGKGNWEKYFRFVPKRMRGNVVCSPPVREIERYYAAADAFVLPSIYEPFGNANLEALATGLPVVTSRFTGAADIIRHGESGLIVQEPGNPRELAKNILLLFNKEAREEMGRQARTLAEQFSQQRNIETMIRLYEELKQRSSP